MNAALPVVKPSKTLGLRQFALILQSALLLRWLSVAQMTSLPGFVELQDPGLWSRIDYQSQLDIINRCFNIGLLHIFEAVELQAASDYRHFRGRLRSTEGSTK